jgi:hypothetical protein
VELLGSLLSLAPPPVSSSAATSAAELAGVDQVRRHP